jgi:hypothetical protein
MLGTMDECYTMMALRIHCSIKRLKRINKSQILDLNKNLLTRICDLLNLFNLYLTDKSTKKRFSKFPLTNLNVFKCANTILMLMAATHSKKVETEANKSERQ